VFEVPGSNVYSACVATGLVIELAGVKMEFYFKG